MVLGIIRKYDDVANSALGLASVEVWDQVGSCRDGSGVPCCNAVEAQNQTLPAVVKGLANILKDKSPTGEHIHPINNCEVNSKLY